MGTAVANGTVIVSIPLWENISTTALMGAIKAAVNKLTYHVNWEYIIKLKKIATNATTDMAIVPSRVFAFSTKRLLILLRPKLLPISEAAASPNPHAITAITVMNFHDSPSKPQKTVVNSAIITKAKTRLERISPFFR